VVLIQIAGRGSIVVLVVHKIWVIRLIVHISFYVVATHGPWKARLSFGIARASSIKTKWRVEDSFISKEITSMLIVAW
jgi:hypothetical protein